jgi:hypothetical protein
MKEIQSQLLEKISDIPMLKYKIIELTGEYEHYLSKGKRSNIHLEAYILALLNLLHVSGFK